MKHLVTVVLGGLLLAFTACGSDGNNASINPPGGDTVAERDGDTLPGDGLPAGDTNPICQIDCSDKECGSDGCGGTCGACGAGMNCLDGQCTMGCDSPDCALSLVCAFADGTPALCGGTITFDHDLQGQELDENIDIETAFAAAGVYFYTPSDDAVVATNPWELDSASGKNSCASFDKSGQPWREPVFIRFAKPVGESAFQAATHYVSFYLGDTWPGGLAVDFYPPGPSPGSPGVNPFDTEMSTGNGTNFIEFGSGDPIGYVVIHKADDPDFTIDDLTFGPLYVP